MAAGEADGACEAAGVAEARGVDSAAEVGSSPCGRCTRSLIVLRSPDAPGEDSMTSEELRRSWVRLAELSEDCSTGTEASRSSGG